MPVLAARYPQNHYLVTSRIVGCRPLDGKPEVTVMARPTAAGDPRHPQLCPRDEPLPDKIRTGVGYLFTHRHRLRYQQFREAGYPLGSGTVESACKVVMQERMKQAGMRWSREGAQVMLALRSVLLSERWDEVRATLHPSPKLT
jgi:hypothetical protein